MNRQDVKDWLGKWPRDEMPVEVRRDGFGNVCLVVTDLPCARFDPEYDGRTNEVFEFVIGAYPDKLEV